VTPHEVLQEIRKDAERDAKSLDGQPFTGKVIGQKLGEIYAMIDGLARVIEALIPEDGKRD
jgi:hypothetical protein